MCMCVYCSFLLWLLCYLNSEPQRTIQHPKFLCSEQMPGLSLEEHTGIRQTVLANGLRWNVCMWNVSFRLSVPHNYNEPLPRETKFHAT
uniref:Putative secreted protein n=1 Tax=Anopheles darlingi TaxID=43151 RepID=A0A2M4D5I2_ANODA